MSARRGAARSRASGVTLATVRKLALALPAAEEGTSYGTRAFRVRGSLFARLHEDGESLVVKIPLDAREIRMAMDPRTFYITEHYRKYPMMLVRLATLHVDDLHDLLRASWRISAPKRLVATLDDDPPWRSG